MLTWCFLNRMSNILQINQRKSYATTFFTWRNNNGKTEQLATCDKVTRDFCGQFDLPSVETRSKRNQRKLSSSMTSEKLTRFQRNKCRPRDPGHQTSHAGQFVFGIKKNKRFFVSFRLMLVPWRFLHHNSDWCPVDGTHPFRRLQSAKIPEPAMHFPQCFFLSSFLRANSIPSKSTKNWKLYQKKENPTNLTHKAGAYKVKIISGRL